METNAESKLEIGHWGTRGLSKLEEANSTHLEAASNSADI
jgi:hypothetical protein